MNSARIPFFLVLLTSCPLSILKAGSSTGDLKPGRNDVEFDHQGRTRTAVIMVPRSTAPPSPGWPLVMMLHGGGGSSQNAIESTGWAKLGEQEGIVMVFPNGTPADESRPPSFLGNPRTWNSGATESLSSGPRSAAAKKIDDVGFLAELIERVCRQLKIDPRRIYVAGHSNGAQMAYLFGSEQQNLVAAVGVMAGHSYARRKKLESPVSLLQIVGDRDPFTPMAGGKAGIMGRTANVVPALDAPQRWARSLGIADEAMIRRDDDTLTVRTWGPAANGAEVRSIVIKGHGHAYPSPQDQFHPALLFGPSVNSLHATETMWEFFRQHPKPN